MLPSSLVYFKAVAIYGSIREAAEHLYIAGSAVSRQINLLEDNLGTALFKRTSYGMKLTQAGRILLAHVMETEKNIAETQAKIADIAAIRRGDVIVFAPPELLDDVISNVILAFNQAHPEVEIIIHCANADSALYALQHDLADITLAMNAAVRPDTEVVGRIAQHPHLVMAPHLRPSVPTGYLELLARLPMAVPDASTEINGLFNHSMEAAGVGIRPALSSGSIAMIKRYVTNGQALTILPESAVANEIRQGTLHSVPLPWPFHHSYSIDICLRRDRSHSMAANAFLAILFQFSNADPVVPVLDLLPKGRERLPGRTAPLL